MLKILSAFAHANKHGIVHRDVKPSNILVTKDDDIKVLDLGWNLDGVQYNLIDAHKFR